MGSLGSDGCHLHELRRSRHGRGRRARRLGPPASRPAPPSLRLAPAPVRLAQARGKPAPSAAGDAGRVNVILNLASSADRRLAAIATTNGAALFYGFGNFCALAALPDLESMQRGNRLKGRPLGQPGSVTSDPWRAHRVFDWDGVERHRIEGLMDDFLALGPIG